MLFSGIGYPTVKRDPKNRDPKSKDGSDGVDGRAGESGGNVTMITNDIRYAEKLTIKLNGGNGEGGQDGGTGSDGDPGIKITKDSFIKTILEYESLKCDKWKLFDEYHPGSGWSVTENTERNKTVYKYQEEWIYREYKHTDGRELTYAFTGDCGMYNTYDIVFYMKGTDGTMAGLGGKNGLAGEGGNAGVLTAICRKAEIGHDVFGKVEVERGIAGDKGESAESGISGENGNHMAMIDRSAGSIKWIKRRSQHFPGESGKERLDIKYNYNKTDSNVLNGLRKHYQKYKDCYMTFTSTAIIRSMEKTKADGKRESERSSNATAVSKQNISKEELLEEFDKICEGDELILGSITEFTAFEVEKEEEEKEQEQMHEEISIVRTLIEDHVEHEKNLRLSVVKPEEVIAEVKLALGKRGKLNLVELIKLWEKIFTVPLDASPLKPLLKLLRSKAHVGFFTGQSQIGNGMYRHQVKAFIENVKNKFDGKRDLSRLEITAGNEAKDLPLELKDGELADVEPAQLHNFWVEVDTDVYKNSLLQPFFDRIGGNDLCGSNDLLNSLCTINFYLKSKKDVFAPFDRAPFDWANIPAVQDHLQAFLTKEEKEAAELKEKQEEAIEKTQEVEEAMEMDEETDPSSGIQKADEEFEIAVEVGQDFEESTTSKLKRKAKNKFGEIRQKYLHSNDAKKSDGGHAPEEEKTKWYSKKFGSFFHSKEESRAFKIVAQTFPDDEVVERVFSTLIALLDLDPKLAERFCIERSSLTKQLKYPGSSAQSLVHMYYLTEQILSFNIQLIRYYLPFSQLIIIPEGWHNEQKEFAMETVEDLLKWSRTNGLPIIGSDMLLFLRQNGIRCRSYRQMVADDQKVNIQVFCESGFCKMRLVESLNPESSNTQRLLFKDGELRSIEDNTSLRKFRADLSSTQLNIPLPLSNEPLQLASYFPDVFKEKVQEWTEAVIIATGCEMLPRFFQRLFELRGNSMTIIELQFAFNTIIEANRNFGIPLDQLCKKMLVKNGCIDDIFLSLRVMGSLKWKLTNKLLQQLSNIKEPQLRALLGSKLHETTMTESVLTSLVNMLAHADDRVSQLATMDMKEWIDIAKCQKWNSYEPLVKAYGKVGYYIVLLETGGRNEGQRLEQIIVKLKERNKKLFILEKVISTVTFLISNNEVDFDDTYEQALLRLLGIISQKCVESSHMERDSFKTDNIYLITNEGQGNVMIDDGTAVMPEKERSLEELIRLTENRQDSEAERSRRQQEMATIKNILLEKVEDNCGEKLKEIDDQLLRICGKKLRNTQKIAILAAARSGKNLLSQVNTGEGKTLLIACLAILRIIIKPEDTVDIITSSSVLAQRDAEAMKELYNAFGIQVGHNCDGDMEKRKQAYKCGVVYGDIARFERDYLLQTFYKKYILGSRTRCNVIVDEVDAMLLDNGSNMLYLSHNVAGLELLDSLFVYLHKLVYTPALIEAEEENFSSPKLRQKVLADMCGLVTKEDIKGLLFDKRDTTPVEKIWRILVTQDVIDSEGILQGSWVSR